MTSGPVQRTKTKHDFRSDINESVIQVIRELCPTLYTVFFSNHGAYNAIIQIWEALAYCFHNCSAPLTLEKVDTCFKKKIHAITTPSVHKTVLNAVVSGDIVLVEQPLLYRTQTLSDSLKYSILNAYDLSKLGLSSWKSFRTVNIKTHFLCHQTACTFFWCWQLWPQNQKACSV